MIPIYPTTELEAVNDILSVLGESPVSTLEDNGRVDAAVAVTILRSTSRAVQSQGWVWNTEKAYTLTPSFPDNYLYVPSNTLRIDSSEADRRVDVVQRGTRLWNRKDHTFVFPDPVTVDVVVGLGFEEIPQPARYYITLRTGRIYQDRFLGSDLISAFAESDERAALADLKHEETESGDFNFLNGQMMRRILER